jgi:hypothetical protein
MILHKHHTFFKIYPESQVQIWWNILWLAGGDWQKQNVRHPCLDWGILRFTRLDSSSMTEAYKNCTQTNGPAFAAPSWARLNLTQLLYQQPKTILLQQYTSTAAMKHVYCERTPSSLAAIMESWDILLLYHNQAPCL